MCRYGAVLRDLVVTIDLAELRADVAMQLVVQRLDLFPQLGSLRLELGRGHIVIGAPHLTHVTVAEFSGAFVGELDKAGVLLAHRHGNRAPAGPVFEQFVVVA